MERIPIEMMSEEELGLYRTLSRKKKLKGMTLEDLKRMRLRKDVM